MTRNLCMFAVLMVTAAAPGAGAQSDTQDRPQALKMSAEGRMALAGARKVADQVKGLEGEMRQGALERAAQSYEAVIVSYLSDPACCAAANFEAAELWRRHGSLAVAGKAYGRAAQLDPYRYGERGLLQVAHMQRRQKQVIEAHQGYVNVAAMNPGSSRAHEARLWVGRTLVTLGRPEESIIAYRRAVEAAGRPRQVIEACNWLAKSLVAAADLEGAAAALGVADQAVQKAAMAGDGTGVESLKKALAKMSARKALQRAKDKKSGAHEDARRLEKGRRGSGS